MALYQLHYGMQESCIKKYPLSSSDPSDYFRMDSEKNYEEGYYDSLDEAMDECFTRAWENYMEIDKSYRLSYDDIMLHPEDYHLNGRSTLNEIREAYMDEVLDNELEYWVEKIEDEEDD